MDDAKKEKKTKVEVMPELGTIPEPPDTNEEQEGPKEDYDKNKVEVAIDQDQVDKSWDYIEARLSLTYDRYVDAENEFMKAQLDVAKHLFRTYFLSNPYRVKDRNPRKKESWNELRSKSVDKEWFKETKWRNLLHIAMQQQWLDEQKVNIKGLNYSALVTLAKMENGQAKIDLLAKAIAEKLSSRAIDAEIPPKLVTRKELPEMNEVFSSALNWLSSNNAQALQIKRKTIGDLNPEDKAKLVDDWKKAKESFQVAIKHLQQLIKSASEK